MWNLKRNNTNELTYKIEKDSQTERINLWEFTVGGGEGWGKRIVREFGMGTYTLLCLKWITSKNLCIAQGTLLNVMRQPGREGSLGENGYMYMYG